MTTLVKPPALQPAATPKRAASGLFDPRMLLTSLPDALRKLDPRVMVKNPVMFVVEVGAVASTIFAVTDSSVFVWWIVVWLWLTVIFANLAEAVAEGRGKAQAETLRRVNQHLGSFERAFDRGVFIRTFLADERLVPRGGERYWPEPDQVEECRRRGCEAVAFVQRLRTLDLYKSPGIAETIDWSNALTALNMLSLDPAGVHDTLGVLLKHRDDMARMQGADLARLLAELRATREKVDAIEAELAKERAAGEERRRLESDLRDTRVRGAAHPAAWAGFVLITP